MIDWSIDFYEKLVVKEKKHTTFRSEFYRRMSSFDPSIRNVYIFSTFHCMFISSTWKWFSNSLALTMSAPVSKGSTKSITLLHNLPSKAFRMLFLVIFGPTAFAKWWVSSRWMAKDDCNLGASLFRLVWHNQRKSMQHSGGFFSFPSRAPQAYATAGHPVDRVGRTLSRAIFHNASTTSSTYSPSAHI